MLVNRGPILYGLDVPFRTLADVCLTAPGIAGDGRPVYDDEAGGALQEGSFDKAAPLSSLHAESSTRFLHQQVRSMYRRYSLTPQPLQLLSKHSYCLSITQFVAFHHVSRKWTK